MAKIITTATVRPKYSYSTKEIVEAADRYWLAKSDKQTRIRAVKLIEAAEIKSRCAVVPLEVVFSDLSFEERNNIYMESMIEMGTAVLQKALDQSGIDPKEIDTIITTSCTGFMIPSVDAYIINRLGLKESINRLPITEMGCAGGATGLIYASKLMKAAPQGKIALISVETPSLTFQKNDLSMDNLVSTAIFADGASCVILGETDDLRPEIIATNSYHFPNAEHLMGYKLQNSGLKIVLDRDVPNSIAENFPHIFHPFLEENGITPEEISNYMFHPGGKKIIRMVEKYLSNYDKDVSDSVRVLQEYGNMSSSTIIYILDVFMKKNIAAGEKGYLLAFGPGFMAQSLLLEWK